MQLLKRHPPARLGANSNWDELKKNPFFQNIDWAAVAKGDAVPPPLPNRSPRFLCYLHISTTVGFHVARSLFCCCIFFFFHFLTAGQRRRCCEQRPRTAALQMIVTCCSTRGFGLNYCLLIATLLNQCNIRREITGSCERNQRHKLGNALPLRFRYSATARGSALRQSSSSTLTQYEYDWGMGWGIPESQESFTEKTTLRPKASSRCPSAVDSARSCELHAYSSLKISFVFHTLIDLFRCPILGTNDHFPAFGP